MPRVVFLPGASGDADFWRPVTDRLPAPWEAIRLSWPGLGDQPHDPSIGGLDDLVERAVGALSEPSDIVAQSIGGLVALRAAAAYPHLVRRLVLAATSAGLDAIGRQAADWRGDYRHAHPWAARWVTEPVADHSDIVRRVTAPTLLLWTDSDPISPIAVGERLAGMLADARLAVVACGEHTFARDRPDEVAALIAEHLG